jgi:hypothetical protein
MTPYPELLARYRKKHGKLVEPVQGFGSLHGSLHLAYSMGRQRGFTDLGTYVNKPGDHGWNDKDRMAAAFDLGREDRFLFKGWNYVKARRLAKLYVREHRSLGIEYVILGRRIWSRTNGWHSYTHDSSHDFHIHVSGHVAHQ